MRIVERFFENLSHKHDQLELILKLNPMYDDYHKGIRTINDIKTFEEAIEDDESFVYGDFSYLDAKKALESGFVRVYSSYPIENCVFVSTSRNMASDYCGRVREPFSKIVNINDVAWIDGDEGMYANANEAML